MDLWLKVFSKDPQVLSTICALYIQAHNLWSHDKFPCDLNWNEVEIQLLVHTRELQHSKYQHVYHDLSPLGFLGTYIPGSRKMKRIFFSSILSLKVQNLLFSNDHQYRLKYFQVWYLYTPHLIREDIQTLAIIR